MIADYDYDAEEISKANERSGGYLIPIVKMLKAAKRTLIPDMTSYHLEVLAMNIIPAAVAYFREQRRVITYPLLVWSFFACAPGNVLQPARINGSKSPLADGYMSIFRKQEISALFQKAAGDSEKTFGMTETDARREWRKIFGEPFPSVSSLSSLEALIWAQTRPKI